MVQLHETVGGQWLVDGTVRKMAKAQAETAEALKWLVEDSLPRIIKALTKETEQELIPIGILDEELKKGAKLVPGSIFPDGTYCVVERAVI